jgi:hypothetical protein
VRPRKRRRRYRASDFSSEPGELDVGRAELGELSEEDLRRRRSQLLSERTSQQAHHVAIARVARLRPQERLVASLLSRVVVEGREFERRFCLRGREVAK